MTNECLPLVHWRLVNGHIIWVKVGVEGGATVGAELRPLRFTRGRHVTVVSVYGCDRSLKTSNHSFLHVILKRNNTFII